VAWTDADLVRRALIGDRDAFGTLVERHRRTLYAWALQHGLDGAQAEDVTQEVFVRAYQGLGTLYQPGAFARWLYGIATNVLADAARSHVRRRDGVSLGEGAEATAASDIPGDEARREEYTRVLRALEELPASQRLVIVLRYLEGLSPKEIAERLGEPRGTIRSRLHHALMYLQTALGGAPVGEGKGGDR
jgi:RNA polymerase sigma-70 factor (ECF subfamily)